MSNIVNITEITKNNASNVIPFWEPATSLIALKKRNFMPTEKGWEYKFCKGDVTIVSYEDYLSCGGANEFTVYTYIMSLYRDFTGNTVTFKLDNYITKRGCNINSIMDKTEKKRIRFRIASEIKKAIVGLSNHYFELKGDNNQFTILDEKSHIKGRDITVILSSEFTRIFRSTTQRTHYPTRFFQADFRQSNALSLAVYITRYVNMYSNWSKAQKLDWQYRLSVKSLLKNTDLPVSNEVRKVQGWTRLIKTPFIELLNILSNPDNPLYCLKGYELDVKDGANFKEFEKAMVTFTPSLIIDHSERITQRREQTDADQKSVTC